MGAVGLDSGDRNHRAGDGGYVARNDGPELHDDRTGDDDRVDAFLRHRGVTATAGDGDLEIVFEGAERAGQR